MIGLAGSWSVGGSVRGVEDAAGHSGWGDKWNGELRGHMGLSGPDTKAMAGWIQGGIQLVEGQVLVWK